MNAKLSAVYVALFTAFFSVTPASADSREGEPARLTAVFTDNSLTDKSPSGVVDPYDRREGPNMSNGFILNPGGRFLVGSDGFLAQLGELPTVESPIDE